MLKFWGHFNLSTFLFFSFFVIATWMKVKFPENPENYGRRSWGPL